MGLSKKEFDILSHLAVANKRLTQREIEDATQYSLGTINKIMREMGEKEFVQDGLITKAGLNALEPHRVRRAIFLAAGFGTRLVPITFNTPKPLIRVHGIRIIDRLIDACLGAGINEIYIVRGYLGELFDQLLHKYPMIKFLENPLYNEANNISSALVARHMLSNAYVFEADLLIKNPAIIKKYHYGSDFLCIKKERSDDWCFRVKEGVIVEEKVGGEGDDIWQMVGISYWDEVDGNRLQQDIKDVFESPGGRERYWEQVPLVYRKEHYAVAPLACLEEDVVEIDTFRELKAIDKTYDV